MSNGCKALKTLWTILISIVLTNLALADLKVLDRPMYIFPGQTFRVALEQPPGSGELRLEVPTTLEMFDQWSKDVIQRFYFRAVKKGDATLRFHGKGGELQMSLEVIPWAGVFEQRKSKNILLPRIWPLDAPSCRELKSQRTLHSEKEVNSLKGRKPGPLAEQWSELTDDQIFNIIPGPCVPRTCLMMLGGYEDARGKGCPVCGTKIYERRSYFYPWLFDPKNHPWKIGCPSCGNWFPSNAFQNGDMHSGDFPDDGFGCEPVKPVLARNIENGGSVTIIATCLIDTGSRMDQLAKVSLFQKRQKFQADLNSTRESYAVYGPDRVGSQHWHSWSIRSIYPVFAEQRMESLYGNSL